MVTSRMLSFNNEALKKTLKSADEAMNAPLPKAEANGAWYETLAERLKPFALNFDLGDKSLEFLDQVGPQLSSSASMRAMAWPLQVASLLSTKMMLSVQGLPATKVESVLLRYAALTGLSTQGKSASDYAQGLSNASRERLRNVERKLPGAAIKNARATAPKGVPAARGAALGGVFDVCNALSSLSKLSAKPDARSASEAVRDVLQGVGSIMDYRAKAYELTVFKGVQGVNLFTAKAMQGTVDQVQTMTLTRMRLTAFKFLLPAAVVSAVLDGLDAGKSGGREQYKLMAAQIAGVFGTVLTITGIGLSAVGSVLGIAEMAAAVSATLGLIGAVLAVTSFVAIIILSEPDWVNWLTDNPLSKGRKGKIPIHENMQETLQSLSNAKATA